MGSIYNPAAAASSPVNTTVTQVFSGTTPTSWTDMDLSAVAPPLSWVLLKVLFGGAGFQTVAFRRNGDTDEFYAASAYAPGCASFDGGSESHKAILVITDAAGIVEWIAESAQAGTTVDVMATVT